MGCEHVGILYVFYTNEDTGFHVELNLMPISVGKPLNCSAYLVKLSCLIVKKLIMEFFNLFFIHLSSLRYNFVKPCNLGDQRSWLLFVQVLGLHILVALCGRQMSGHC